MRRGSLFASPPTARAVALQFQAGGFTGGRDFLFGLRLGLDDFRRGVPPEAPGFGLFFLAGGGAQSGELGLEVGQPPVHFGRARFGLLARLAGVDDVLADLRARAAKNGPPFLPMR